MSEPAERATPEVMLTGAQEMVLANEVRKAWGVDGRNTQTRRMLCAAVRRGFMEAANAADTAWVSRIEAEVAKLRIAENDQRMLCGSAITVEVCLAHNAALDTLLRALLPDARMTGT